MKILELFSGTESFSKVARERGHETFTVDIDKQFDPNLCKDIMDLKIEDIPFKPDFIWCSPPCNKFSIASVYRHWNAGKPKHEGVYQSLLLVAKTISLILALKPKYWLIENPRGMLRKQPMMLNFKRNTVTYCQYGFNYMKATDLWNNLSGWNSRPMCKPGADCHDEARRGTSQTGVQSMKGHSAKNRAKIPRELCEEILDYLEKELE